jgi:hypothetical protein
VDNTWVNGKVKQRVLHRLGRLDELVASGQLDTLLRSLGRFSEKLSILGAHLNGDSLTTHSARIGPALIGQRLWQTCSIDKVLTALLRERQFEFSVDARSSSVCCIGCSRRAVIAPLRNGNRTMPSTAPAS